MKLSKLFFIFIMLCMIATQLHAQDIKIKSVTPRPNDLSARTSSRIDGEGKNCALIKVAIVGVDDLVFSNAIGSTSYSDGEYLVYISEETKTIEFESKDKGIKSKINFEDYGLEIEESKVYSIVLSTGNDQRTATFFVEPVNAEIKVDGKKQTLDDEGKLTISITNDKHIYEVYMEGYKLQRGEIPSGEEDWVNSIALDPYRHEVSFVITPATHTLLIDNKRVEGDKISLTEGNHDVRVVADGYNEYTQSLSVQSYMSPIYINLEKAKEEVIKDKRGQSDISVNLLNSHYYSLGFGVGAKEMSSLFKLKTFTIFYEYSYLGHFASAMAYRSGASAHLWRDSNIEQGRFSDVATYDDKDELTLLAFDIPVQIGFSIPMGMYNQHLFSILGGLYGSLYLGGSDSDSNSSSNSSFKSDSKSDSDSSSGVFWDYGLRLSTKLDFSHFSIGFDANKSFQDLGYSLYITLAYKAFKNNK